MGWNDIPQALREGWPEHPAPLAETWRELLGPQTPEDLIRLERMRDGGFLLSDPGGLCKADNSFEEVVRLARKNQVLEPILQAFTSTFFLANLPAEGDCLMLHCSHQRETAEVVVWLHEEGFFAPDPVAWDLPTALRLLEVAETRGDPAERAARLAPALGRYEPEWPFDDLEEELDEQGVLALARSGATAAPLDPGSSAFGVLQERSFWIARVLFGAAVDTNALVNQRDMTPHKAMEQPFFSTYAPSALFWLWRSYLIDADWLGDVIDVTRDSPARLVRDTAALVEGLLAGERSTVGGVDLIAARESTIEAQRTLPDPAKPEVWGFDMGPAPTDESDD